MSDEPRHVVPTDAKPWSVANEMMAGAYTPTTRVDVHGLRLYSTTGGPGAPNVWAVHPADGGAATDALNLDRFRTAREVEEYLLDARE